MPALSLFHHLRALLGHGALFDFYQRLIGAPRAKARFVRFMLSCRGTPTESMRILEIGCGTGAFVPMLPPEVLYHGLDHAPRYVARARLRHRTATFFCRDVATLPALGNDGYDVVFTFGVLHHLTPEQRKHLYLCLPRLLRPGGVFAAMEPCRDPRDASLARWLMDHDQGQYIGSRTSYLGQLPEHLQLVRIRELTGLLRVPYRFLAFCATPRNGPGPPQRMAGVAAPGGSPSLRA